MGKKYNNLVIHASKDYQIDLHIVESIYKKYYDDSNCIFFYDALEEYLKNGLY